MAPLDTRWPRLLQPHSLILDPDPSAKPQTTNHHHGECHVPSRIARPEAPSPISHFLGLGLWALQAPAPLWEPRGAPSARPWGLVPVACTPAVTPPVLACWGRGFGVWWPQTGKKVSGVGAARTDEALLCPGALSGYTGVRHAASPHAGRACRPVADLIPRCNTLHCTPVIPTDVISNPVGCGPTTLTQVASS
jgi:hypothetical protein